MARFDRAVGGLLPVLGTAEHLLAEALDDSWWRGLLLRPPSGAEPHGGLFDEQVFDTLGWPEAEELPIVIDCGMEGFSRPGHVKAFLERCPPRPIVLTHGGQLNISGGHLEPAAELFRLYPHTLLETSGIYRQDFLEGMFRDLGARRIVYGSGYPRMDERLETERVAILPASEAEMDLMFEGNARRVFGLPENG